MNTPELLSLAICETLVLSIFAFIPIVRREHAFFGVSVSRHYYCGPGRSVLRRYRFSLTGIYLVAVLVNASIRAFGTNFAWSAIVPLLAIAGALWCYAVAYQRVSKFRNPINANRFASSLRPRRLSDYTHAPLEVTIALVVLVSLTAVALTFPHLPSPMPVHWNLAGQPDRWGPKSLAVAFLVPVLSIYLQVWLFLLKRDSVGLKMTLPGERAEEYLQYKQRALGIGSGLLDWVRLMLAVLLALIALLQITAIPHWQSLQPWINVLIWTSLCLLLAGLAWFIARWFAVSNALDREFGFAIVQRRSEAQHWLGGILYYNREDPAFFVEKLGGLGYTINCAHPRALLHLALLAGVAMIVLLAFSTL